MRAHRFKLTLAAGKIAIQAASRPSTPVFRDGVKRTTPEGATTASGRSRASDWIGEINRAWSRGGTHTMELARVMVAARNRLRYGEWSGLWKSEQMPFAKRKGEMLVVVGDRLGWIDAQYIAHLPASWNVLYWLAKLREEIFRKLIEEGTIHPKLTLGEAKELVARFNGRRRKKKLAGINVKRRLRQFCEYVERTVSQWKPDDRKLAKQELTGLIEQIDAASEKPAARNLDRTLKRELSRRRLTVAPPAVTTVHSTQGRL
jgi:hypothetical protein